MADPKKLLGTDLMLYETALGSDLSGSMTGDIELISEEYNLAQAILHRLRTIKGELADTGHGDYGSNLYDLIGEPNNQTTRDRLKMMIRSTILQEPRIKEIIKIEVRAYVGKSNYGAEWDANKWAKIATVELKRLKAGVSDEEVPDIDDKRELNNKVDVDITVLPIESNVPLNIVFPFYLEVI